jgi:hypothetical protein
MALAPSQAAPADQAPAVSGFHTRAMTPVRNPVYIYNMDDSFKSRHPAGMNVLERPTRAVSDEATRRTAAGSLPPVSGLTPIVPMAGQTPYNVWGLRPA